MKQKGRKRSKHFLNGEETFPLLAKLSEIPTPSAPRHFERSLYRRLGISYLPVHRKVLILSALSLFAGLVYLTGGWLIRTIASRLTLVSVAQFFSMAYTKVLQAISVIRIGYHLKEILLAFTNPWFFVALSVVSSVLMLILIGITREVKGKEVLLSNH